MLMHPIQRSLQIFFGGILSSRSQEIIDHTASFELSPNCVQVSRIAFQLICGIYILVRTIVEFSDQLLHPDPSCCRHAVLLVLLDGYEFFGCSAHDVSLTLPVVGEKCDSSRICALSLLSHPSVSSNTIAETRCPSATIDITWARASVLSTSVAFFSTCVWCNTSLAMSAPSHRLAKPDRPRRTRVVVLVAGAKLSSIFVAAGPASRAIVVSG